VHLCSPLNCGRTTLSGRTTNRCQWRSWCWLWAGTQSQHSWGSYRPITHNRWRRNLSTMFSSTRSCWMCSLAVGQSCTARESLSTSRYGRRLSSSQNRRRRRSNNTSPQQSNHYCTYLKIK
jgi:hypothetical protein